MLPDKIGKSLALAEGVPVTVCVAALYGGGVGVIGASDRMVTAGDIQFEPQQTKLVALTTSITLMLAGDASLQLDIVYQLRADVRQRIKDDPETWISVKTVADLYAHYYALEKRKRSEKAILAPIGLDHDSFVYRQQEMSPELVKQLATELINYEIPQVSAIVTGVDDDGGHIYLVHGSDVMCQDSIGFAAIGAGYWHANSQMMFGGHHKYSPFPESLLLVYSSKKRAEVAPGVGDVTDMFVIEDRGGYTAVGSHILRGLEVIYQIAHEEQKKAEEESKRSARQYVEEIIAATTAKEQEALPQDSGGDSSTDTKELRDGTEKGEPESK